MALLLLALAYAGATWAAGWLGVLVVAVAWGFARPGRAPWSSGLAAALAWTVLLGANALTGPLAKLAGILGAMLGLPALAPVLLTLAFVALLGWSATRLATAIRGRPTT
jgi:hypothetical protein